MGYINDAVMESAKLESTIPKLKNQRKEKKPLNINKDCNAIKHESLLKEDIVEGSWEDTINKILNVLALHGFVLDDSVTPIRDNWSGGKHLQIIKPEFRFDDLSDEDKVYEEFLLKVRPVADALHALSEELFNNKIGSITFNFGVNADGYITAGLDFRPLSRKNVKETSLYDESKKSVSTMKRLHESFDKENLAAFIEIMQTELGKVAKQLVEIDVLIQEEADKLADELEGIEDVDSQNQIMFDAVNKLDTLLDYVNEAERYLARARGRKVRIK